MALGSPRSSSQSAYICHGAGSARFAWMAWRNASSGVAADGVAFRRPFAFMPLPPSSSPRGSCSDFGGKCVSRRMPADTRPQTAGANRGGAVQVQRGDGGTARRGQANDASAVLGPAEVFGPDLTPWAEQAHHLAGIRVERGDPVVL